MSVLIQTILIFALGFLAALFIAMVAAPAVWERAVFLTRKRIESSLPLSLNELNAEKDALRAEHAMAVCKLEMQLARLKEKDVVQRATITDQGARIGELEQSFAESLTRGAQLDNEVAELSESLDERTTSYSETAVMFEAARTELELKTDALDREIESNEMLTEKLETALSGVAERDVKVGALSANVAELTTVRKELEDNVGSLEHQLRETGEILAAERKGRTSAETELQAATTKNAEWKARLEDREADFKHLQDRVERAEAEVAERDERIAQLEEERRALEDEASEMTLMINQFSATLGERDLEKLPEALNRRIAGSEPETEALLKERDDLRAALEKAGEAQAGSKGDAALREQLNQLAAEVVAVSARIEGPESRINELLAQEADAPPGDIVSLAERIRELQRKAADQKSA